MVSKHPTSRKDNRKRKPFALFAFAVLSFSLLVWLTTAGGEGPGTTTLSAGLQEEEEKTIGRTPGTPPTLSIPVMTTTQQSHPDEKGEEKDTPSPSTASTSEWRKDRSDRSVSHRKSDPPTASLAIPAVEQKPSWDDQPQHLAWLPVGHCSQTIGLEKDLLSNDSHLQQEQLLIGRQTAQRGRKGTDGKTTGSKSTERTSLLSAVPVSEEIHVVLPKDLAAKRFMEKRIDELMRSIGEGNVHQEEFALANQAQGGTVRPEYASRIQREVALLRKRYEDSLYKLEDSSVPSFRPESRQFPSCVADGGGGGRSDQEQSSGVMMNSPFLYVVLSGKNSHATRVEGIENTLGQLRPVLWYSDKPWEETAAAAGASGGGSDPAANPTPRPANFVVLNSALEDQACAEHSHRPNEDKTQLKGCKYQWGFYRTLEMWNHLLPQVLSGGSDTCSGTGAHQGTNANGVHSSNLLRVNVSASVGGESSGKTALLNLSAVRWIVRIADDTLVIPHQLERQLLCFDNEMTEKGDNNSSKKKEKKKPIVAGANITREGYSFFSGGHPFALNRAAFQPFLELIVRQCEGTILEEQDPGIRKRLKKYSWWADDVLLSYCLSQRQRGATTDTGDRPSSTTRFALRSLEGCLSADSFSQLPLPFSLGEQIVNRYYLPFYPIFASAAVADTQTATRRHRNKVKKSKVIWRWIYREEIPTSYHTYPYVTVYQMYGLYHRLYDSGRRLEKL